MVGVDSVAVVAHLDSGLNCAISTLASSQVLRQPSVSSSFPSPRLEPVPDESVSASRLFTRVQAAVAIIQITVITGLNARLNDAIAASRRLAIGQAASVLRLFPSSQTSTSAWTMPSPQTASRHCCDSHRLQHCCRRRILRYRTERCHHRTGRRGRYCGKHPFRHHCHRRTLRHPPRPRHRHIGPAQVVKRIVVEAIAVIAGFTCLQDAVTTTSIETAIATGIVIDVVAIVAFLDALPDNAVAAALR